MKNFLNFLITIIITLVVSAVVGFITLEFLIFITRHSGNGIGNVGLGIYAYAIKYIIDSIIIGLVAGVPLGIIISRRFKIK